MPTASIQSKEHPLEGRQARKEREQRPSLSGTLLSRVSPQPSGQQSLGRKERLCATPVCEDPTVLQLSVWLLVLSVRSDKTQQGEQELKFMMGAGLGRGSQYK